MRLGFSEAQLRKLSTDQLKSIKKRTQSLALIAFLVQISYSSFAPYAWEIGEYIISQNLGYYLLMILFVYFGSNAIIMSFQVEAIENGKDPNCTSDQGIVRKPPKTKLTKFLNQGLMILGLLVVGSLIWMGVGIYNDKGFNKNAEKNRIASVYSKLNSKQCKLDGYHKKYNSSLEPIYVQVDSKRNNYTIKHISNDVTQYVSLNSKPYYASYNCADGSVEKSQYVFRTLLK